MPSSWDLLLEAKRGEVKKGHKEVREATKKRGVG